VKISAAWKLGPANLYEMRAGNEGCEFDVFIVRTLTEIQPNDASTPVPNHSPAFGHCPDEGKSRDPTLAYLTVSQRVSDVELGAAIA